MKFKTLFACILFLIANCNSTIAQKKKPSKKGMSTAWTLHKEMNIMIENASFKGKMYGPCYPMSYLKRLGKSGILPNPKKELGQSMDSLSYMLTQLAPLKLSTRNGFLPMYSFIHENSYVNFVNSVYNKNIGDLAPKNFAASVDAYYRQLKKLKKEGFVFDQRTVTKKECVFKIESRFVMETWEDGNTVDDWIGYTAKISGKIETTITIKCNCKGKSISALKNARFKYEKPTVFLIDFSNKGNRQKFVPADKNLSVLSLLATNCCTENDISFDDPSLELAPTENISLPNQTIGVFGGVGFGQNFEETTLCLGAEYLINVVDLGNNPLFTGANASLETSSFMDNTSTWFGVGPTVQLFTPISASGETLVANGLSANVIFGSNDSDGFKDTVSGFEVGINTGLSVPLNDNLFLSISIPVVNHQNITYEPENGGTSFEQKNTSLLIGKGSTTKLGLRFGF